MSLDSLTSWHSAWTKKKAIVVGLGQVGFAVADTLHELGVNVMVVSDEADHDVLNIAAVLGVPTVIGGEAEQISAATAHQPDFVVVSPGVRPENGVVLALSALGVPVWSDIDFAWRVRDKNDVVARWVLVQGSRVAELATRLLQAEGVIAHQVGFEAPPLLDALRDPQPYETLIISVNPNAVHWWERYPSALRRPFLTLSLESISPVSSGVFFDGTTLACVYRKGVGNTEALDRKSVV